MRIILFTQQLAAFRSGIGTYSHALTNGLVERGHAVSVVVPQTQTVALTDAEVIEVAAPRVDPTPGSWLQLGRAFAQVLSEKQAHYDLAHFTDAREAWRVKRARIPVVGMVNDSYALDWLEPDYPRDLFADRRLRGCYYAILRRMESRTYPRLDGVIANSGHVKHRIACGYRVQEHKLRVIYHGLPYMKPIASVALEGNPSLLFVGGNFQRKGLPILLRAVSQLRARFPGIKVHVVGKDRNQPALASLARELGIEQRVDFHGWQPNERVRGLMCGAHMFVLPSLTEGFGLVCVEAMLARIPVVATASSGVGEVFEDGSEALFVRPNRVQELADAIAKIASDPEYSAKLASAGYAAAGRMSVETMARETEQLFAETLTRRQMR